MTPPILSRKQVEELSKLRSHTKISHQEIARTITALMELVEALAEQPCKPNRGYPTAPEGGCRTCPPCRARAFLKEWRRE